MKKLFKENIIVERVKSNIESIKRAVIKIVKKYTTESKNIYDIINLVDKCRGF